VTAELALGLVESDEVLMMRASVRRIALEFGHARFAASGRTGEPVTELRHALADAGFLGVNVPEAYGGGGLGMFELAVVEEELSAAGCPVSAETSGRPPAPLPALIRCRVGAGELATAA
jgi:alkylation response protein AidB-like acyl-CoA dehydrogenase